MKSGIYAMAGLGDEALQAADLAVMGLARDDREAGFFASRCRDRAPDAGAFVEGATTTRLLGHLDDPAALAVELGMRADASAVELAARAYERWSDNLPARMPGEWSLVRWNADRRELVAVSADTIRDPLFVATDGRWVAVAPSPDLLTRLDWVGRALDPEAVATLLLPWRFRATPGNPCHYRGVHRVEHGTLHAITATGHRKTERRVPQAPQWHGDFAAAVDAMEGMIRAIIRRHLSREGDVAILLSGGLDSSLIAALAVQEARPGQRIFAVSSVTRPQDNLPDERRFIHIVGAHLGMDIHYVTPPDDSEIYHPDPAPLADDVLMPGPRHYLYRALQQVAVLEGATAVMVGDYGEANVTRSAALASPKNILRSIRNGVFRRDRIDIVGDALARPSAGIERLFEKVGRTPTAPPFFDLAWPGARLGPLQGEAKGGKASTQVSDGSLRFLMPLRSNELTWLSAALPAQFTYCDGQSRAIARAILARYLPQSIARRADKMDFSPDYEARLYRHARAARGRVRSYRDCGVGTWLDLDWLDQELDALEHGQRRPYARLMQIQATALTAEALAATSTAEIRSA